MKRILSAILVFCVAFMGFALAEEMDYIEAAKEITQLALADDVDGYYDRLSQTVKDQLSKEDLQTIGKDLAAVYGALEDFGAVQAYGKVIVIPLAMEKGNLIAQIVFGEGDMVDGFFFTPAPEEQERDLTFEENEEEAVVGPHELAAVLSLPGADEPVPAIVLVHGSGPNDRNETLGETAIFRDLAQGLSAQGIAVLRYDKRTYAMRQGLIDYTQEDLDNLTFYDETIEDALAAVALLKEDARIDPERVFILGHSLGGMLANRIEAEGAQAKGLVILAGTLRHLTELMADQLEALDAGTGVFATEIETARALSGMTEEEARGHTLMGTSAYEYWEETQHDLKAIAEETGAPMLILQGTEDQNVYADVDYVLWEEYAKEHPDQDITLKLYEGLGHDFALDNRMSQQVIDDIAAWVLER